MTTDREPRIGISDQFRNSAEALGTGMSLILGRMDERDEAEIEVSRLTADLAAAEARLAVRERRLTQTRELMQPQLSFYLATMETEASDNLVKLREVKAG